MTERLIYPRPANRDLELHTALHELQENEDIFRKFLEDPDAVVGRFDLDDEVGHCFATVTIKAWSIGGCIRFLSCSSSETSTGA